MPGIGNDNASKLPVPFVIISTTSVKNSFDLESAVASAATSDNAATAVFVLSIVLNTVLELSME